MTSSLPSCSADCSASDERIQEEAALWFARLCGDEVSETERAAFTEWLGGDLRRQREFDLLERIWDTSGRLRPAVSSEGPKRRRVLRAAAGIAGILLACGWTGWAWLGDRMSTDSGERRYARLADGSDLYIAPNTHLRVKFDSRRRRLELEEGQIAVSIASDPQRPFEVMAGGGRIRDIGTRFAVETEASRTRVTVAEGLVEIELATSGIAPRRVSAGETAEFDGRGVTPARPVDASATLAWTTGQLVFDSAPLSTVVAALNRYRRTPIELTDPSLADIRISGVFLIGDEGVALRALERVVQIEFVPRAGKMEARPAGKSR